LEILFKNVKNRNGKLTFLDFCHNIFNKGDGVHLSTAVEADNSCGENLKEFFYGLSNKRCTP
jgi:hypothetical protein